MRRTALLALPLLLAACESRLTSPVEPAFAPGGKKPPSSTNVRSATTVHDAWNGTAVQTDVRSDGGGPYLDGDCGVGTWIVVNSDGSNGARLYPQLSTSNCPRNARLRLVTRHITDDDGSGNHVDDDASPLGEFEIGEIKMLLSNGVAVVNAGTPVAGNDAPTSCFDVGKNGRITGQGLRFDAVNFPGSNSPTVQTITPDRHYRVHTAPWPDNVAYCKHNGVVSYWHVTMDLEFEALGN